jgi:hypothetical protein
MGWSIRIKLYLGVFECGECGDAFEWNAVGETLVEASRSIYSDSFNSPSHSLISLAGSTGRCNTPLVI